MLGESLGGFPVSVPGVFGTVGVTLRWCRDYSRLCQEEAGLQSETAGWVEKQFVCLVGLGYVHGAVPPWSAVLVRGGEGRRLRLRCVVGGLVSRSGPWYRDRSGKAVLYGTAVRAPHLAISLVDHHDSHLFSLLISDISAAARAQIEPTNNATAGIPNGPHGYKVHSLLSSRILHCVLYRFGYPNPYSSAVQ